MKGLMMRSKWDNHLDGSKAEKYSMALGNPLPRAIEYLIIHF